MIKKIVILIWLVLCLADCYTSYVLQTSTIEANPLVAPLESIWGANVFIGLAIAALGVAVVSWRWRWKPLIIILGILIIPGIHAVANNLGLMATLP